MIQDLAIWLLGPALALVLLALTVVALLFGFAWLCAAWLEKAEGGTWPWEKKR